MAVSQTLRVAIVQFSPKIGQIQANLNTAKMLCQQLKPRSVDLVCLPEMIFSGYVFESATAILPYLERPRIGPTSQFCSELADRLHCYVVSGYAERLDPEEMKNSADETGNSPVGANSAVLYGPDGRWVGDYRKTNLFEIDESWAKPGNGFATFLLPSPLRTMSLGICMDLNAQPPHSWTIEEGPYEIADYCLSKGTNILVLLNAWLDSGKDLEEDHDRHTQRFWTARLRPLWDRSGVVDELKASKVSSAQPVESGKETLVIICNRTGDENGKTFAGTSSILSMRQGAPPVVLKQTGRKEEGLKLWTVSL